MAERVTQAQGRGEAQKWGADVIARLSANAVDPPAYRADPTGHLLNSWKRELKDAGPKNALTRLEAQSMDMTRLWTQGLGFDQGLKDSLPYDSGDNAAAARTDALNKLR